MTSGLLQRKSGEIENAGTRSFALPSDQDRPGASKMLTRRSFLQSCLALAAAPAIVRASSLMKVSGYSVSSAGLYVPGEIITINVRDFGARGDGIHDDSEAFLNALEYARWNNVSKIVTPRGYYVVPSTDP